MSRKSINNSDRALEADPRVGLRAQQVEASRVMHGHNVLTPAKRTPLWRQFFGKFNDPLIKVLLVALLLSLVLAGYEIIKIGMSLEVLFEPLGIAAAIVLATLVGFIVEVNANKKFDLLNKTNDDIAVKVRRDGHVCQVPRRDVVVGDIVLLDTGEKVPADGTLLMSYNLSVNESSLTGEPEAWKSHDPADEDNKGTYARSRLLRGSNVMEGSGVMRVTAVGDNTEYGRVFAAAQTETSTATPLQMQLERLGKLIAYASYGIAALVVVGRAVAYFADGDSATIDYKDFDYAVKTVMLAVTLVVCSVPEGLPMSITLSLALSMRRLLQHNNLVRRMHACETMGAVTVICTDKTGTLTQNQMQVAELHTYLDDTDDSRRLLHLSMACNSTAHLDTSEQGRTRAIGNPTEGALLLWLLHHGVKYEQVREQCTVEAQLPFTTERKFMATVITDNTTGRRWLLVKGAYEVVSRYCHSVAGVNVTFSQVQDQLAAYQLKAMRALAFASAPLADGEQPIDVKNDRLNSRVTMQLIGIVAISDPVRPDVAAAVADCQRAGIKVKVITGDNAITAREVAKQVGINVNDRYADFETITGPEFASLSDERAAQRASQIKIMSRARPSDKERLVSLLQQRRGEVVAVTGDGTNDAPALNMAQVGLSMGDGTSVAKEASDITIMDNSFASINKAVLWGRALYRNIQRFIVFQLTVNVCACLVVAIGSFFSMQPVLTVTQMLWVNLIMDTLAALALASLPPNSIVMREKPRGLTQSIFTTRMKWWIGVAGLVFTVIMLWLYYHLHTHQGLFGAYNGMHPINAHEMAIYFTTFIMLQFWNLFNVRMLATGHSWWGRNWRHSKFFFGVVLVILIGQAVIVMCGWLAAAFNCEPISGKEFGIILLATSPVMFIGTIVNWIYSLRHEKPLLREMETAKRKVEDRITRVNDK